MMVQHAVPLRLVDAEPLGRLSRTLEALLVIASAPRAEAKASASSTPSPRASEKARPAAKQSPAP